MALVFVGCGVLFFRNLLETGLCLGSSLTGVECRVCGLGLGLWCWAWGLRLSESVVLGFRVLRFRVWSCVTVSFRAVGLQFWFVGWGFGVLGEV